MRDFVLSHLAEDDLRNIADCTLGTWGERQAILYIEGISSTCQMLADQPLLGRAYGRSRPGLRRMEYSAHVLFYRETEAGIRVIWILHQRMDPNRHELHA